MIDQENQNFSRKFFELETRLLKIEAKIQQHLDEFQNLTKKSKMT